MKHASTLRLYRCWAALKGRASAPARADLRPHLLGSAMLDMFTLRREPFVFGYAGSRLRAGLATNLDQLNFASIWRASDRADVQRLLRGIVAHRQPVLLGGRRLDAAPATDQAEILLLPTIESSGERGIVGALAASRDWLASASVGSELALAAVATPDQVLGKQDSANASRAFQRPLRPRLLTSHAQNAGPVVEIQAR